MATPYLLSHDGVELQFATNHIGISFMVNAPYFVPQHVRILFAQNNFFTDQEVEDTAVYSIFLFAI